MKLTQVDLQYRKKKSLNPEKQGQRQYQWPRLSKPFWVRLWVEHTPFSLRRSSVISCDRRHLFFSNPITHVSPSCVTGDTHPPASFVHYPPSASLVYTPPPASLVYLPPLASLMFANNQVGVQDSFTQRLNPTSKHHRQSQPIGSYSSTERFLQINHLHKLSGVHCNLTLHNIHTVFNVINFYHFHVIDIFLQRMLRPS